jgi:hypothetical protein
LFGAPSSAFAVTIAISAEIIPTPVGKEIVMLSHRATPHPLIL